MSRTTRKSSLTEERSLVQHINHELSYLKSHNHRYERYMTESGQKAYEAAIAEWEVAHALWLRTGVGYPKQPYEYEYCARKAISKETDFEAEAADAAEYYKSAARDGRYYSGPVKKNYRKCCAKEIRNKNKRLCHAILKDDESWDQQPFPDRHLGKKHVWSFW